MMTALPADADGRKLEQIFLAHPRSCKTLYDSEFTRRFIRALYLTRGGIAGDTALGMIDAFRDVHSASAREKGKGRKGSVGYIERGELFPCEFFRSLNE